MADFDDLLLSIDENTRIEDYLQEFFASDNFASYEIPADYSDDETRAVEAMFAGNSDIWERVDQALAYDPFCLEAFFVTFMLSDDAYLYYYGESMYEEAENFAQMSPAQQRNYLRILDFFADFLLEIRNLSKSKKIQELLLRLSREEKPSMIDRAAFTYSLLEDKDAFYDLYLTHELGAMAYLMLIVCLLKYDETEKAKEVLQDMYLHIPYADYLDHLWELELNDDQQLAFYETVEACFDEISSVPDFFFWVSTIDVPDKNSYS